MSIKVYLMATLDNYMFRPLLAISVPTGKGPYIEGHLGLPTTRPQLRGRKRNTPLHNTSGPKPSNLTLATSTTMPLVTAYHHI